MPAALGNLLQNWRLKLAAFALSVLLWVVLSAEQSTSRWLPVPVEIALRDPAYRLVPTSVPDQVEVRFVGPGRELLELAIQRPRLVVPISEVEDTSELFLLEPRMVQAPNGLAAVPQDVRPGRIRLEFERITRRDIPVAVQISAQPAGGRVLAESLDVSPQRVRVRGPADRLETISAVLTLPLDLSREESNFVRTVPVDTTGLGNLDLGSREVRVSGRVQRIVQQVLQGVPVRVPDGYIASPAEISVVLTGPADPVSTIEPADLRVVVSPADLPSALPAEGALFPVRVDALPNGVRAETRPAVVRIIPVRGRSVPVGPAGQPPAAVPLAPDTRSP